MSIECCNNISNIYNGIRENEEDSLLCGKKDDTVDIFSIV